MSLITRFFFLRSYPSFLPDSIAVLYKGPGITRFYRGCAARLSGAENRMTQPGRVYETASLSRSYCGSNDIHIPHRQDRSNMLVAVSWATSSPCLGNGALDSFHASSPRIAVKMFSSPRSRLRQSRLRSRVKSAPPQYHQACNPSSQRRPLPCPKKYVR